MECTSLTKWSMGCGSPGGRTRFSFQAQVPVARTLSRPNGRLWPSGLISRPAVISVGTPSGTDVFTEVVLLAGASFGTASGSGRGSRWARLNVNRKDPVEMALAADLQRSALAHVAVSSCGKYTGMFNTFVA
jgi:hypothetical protein